MEDLSECYRILDLEPGASIEDAKGSYRELVKVWHPDRFRGDPKLQAKAEEKLKRINLAYERLCKEAGAGDRRRSAPPPPPTPKPEQSRPETRAEPAHQENAAEAHANPEHPPRATTKVRKAGRLARLIRQAWATTRMVALGMFMVGFLVTVFVVALQHKEADRYHPFGDRVPQDEAKAFEWFHKAAIQGDWGAQVEISRRYDEGIGVRKDQAKADEWFRKALLSEDAAQRDTKARPNVGTHPTSAATGTTPTIEDAMLRHLTTDDRLATGFIVVDRLSQYSGKGKLTLDNGLAEDAYAKLVLNGKLVAAFYVRSQEKFTYSTIPDGTYTVLYCTGYGWDAGVRNFARGRHARRYDAPLDYSTRRQRDGSGFTTYTDVMTLTLHKVLSGNARTSDMPLEDFDRY